MVYTFLHSLTFLSPFFDKNCKYFKVHLHNRKIGYRPVGKKKTHTSESLSALNDTLWGPAFLSDMDYAFGPWYAISAIITKADVRIKKMIQTRFFSG